MNNNSLDQQDQNINQLENISESFQNIIAEQNPYCAYYKTGLQLCNEEIQKEEYLIEPIIVKNGINAIVGSSGVGKTMLGRQMALGIANKDETLFGFKINADFNKVIYVSTEDPEYQWKKSLLAFNPDGSKDEALSRLYLIFGSPDVLLKAIESKLKIEKVDLIIVDVYSDVYCGDPNNSIQVRSFIKSFKNLSYRYGVTPLFCHHNGKGTEKSAPSKNSVLGSQAFESSMRSLIELRADQYDSSKRHLRILKQNYLSEENKKQSYVLQLNDNMTFSNTGERRDLAFLSITSQKIVQDQEMVKRVLELNGNGLSCRGIEQALKEQGIQRGKTKIAEIIKENKIQHSSAAAGWPDQVDHELGKVVSFNSNGENRLFDLDDNGEDFGTEEMD